MEWWEAAGVEWWEGGRQQGLGEWRGWSGGGRRGRGGVVGQLIMKPGSKINSDSELGLQMVIAM